MKHLEYAWKRYETTEYVYRNPNMSVVIVSWMSQVEGISCEGPPPTRRNITCPLNPFRLHMFVALQDLTRFTLCSSQTWMHGFSTSLTIDYLIGVDTTMFLMFSVPTFIRRCCHSISHISHLGSQTYMGCSFETNRWYLKLIPWQSTFKPT